MTRTLALLLAVASQPTAVFAQSTVDFTKRPEPENTRPESQLYRKGHDGQEITVSGYIEDVPQHYSGEGGKYQSWNFKLNADANKNHGDEYLMVRFHTVKWNFTVGTFNYKKGDRVTLSGRFSEFKGNRGKGGILGSLQVNDLSYKDVVK